MKGTLTLETHLTSGDVAKMLQVAPRTVTLWCRRGVLNFHRLPVGLRCGSKINAMPHRRIIARDVIKFCQEQEMPIPTDLARLIRGKDQAQ